VGHQTLRELTLSYGRVDNTDDARRAAGEQLASLITHNSGLQKLNLENCSLGEAGLAPIFEALPRSSTLKELVYYVAPNETISPVFGCDVIFAAVRANCGLRTFRFGHFWPLEAQALVAARTQPDGGAIVAA